MNETHLVRTCIDYLLYRGHYVWRNNTGMIRSSYTDKSGNTSNRMWKAGLKGSADILGISKDGKFIAVECKIKPNKPSEFQKEFLQKISNRGGFAIVAYDIEDLEKGGL